MLANQEAKDKKLMQEIQKEYGEYMKDDDDGEMGDLHNLLKKQCNFKKYQCYRKIGRRRR